MVSAHISHLAPLSRRRDNVKANPMLETTVVNVKYGPCDVYVGRPSIFGNTYRIGFDGTREEVIAKYRDYFYKRVEQDMEFRRQALMLRGKRLGCWCGPNLCHGIIIAEWLEIVVADESASTLEAESAPGWQRVYLPK